MKVLMVSYRFDPYPSVAARRTSYWAQNWKELRGQDTIDVLSTTKQNAELIYLNKYHYVPLGQKRTWSLIKDEGVQWKRDIIEYFDQHSDLKYDLVLMTGGPFMQFSLTPFFKRTWRCKVILDFRDPFADNPRFGNSWLKKVVKRHFENKFLRVANGAIVVNEYCVDLVKGIKKLPFSIIPNGFDESAFVPCERLFGNRIVHAGSFYVGSPKPLLEELNTEQMFDLDHYGKELIVDYESNPKFHQFGQIAYGMLTQKLCQYKSGLVIISKPFESTTKVYDYIGAGCALLILSYIEPWTGTLADELKPYQKFIIWEKMDEPGIKKALEGLKGIDAKPSRELVQTYSRIRGLKKLINWIETKIL